MLKSVGIYVNKEHRLKDWTSRSSPVILRVTKLCRRSTRYPQLEMFACFLLNKQHKS